MFIVTDLVSLRQFVQWIIFDLYIWLFSRRVLSSNIPFIEFDYVKEAIQANSPDM